MVDLAENDPYRGMESAKKDMRPGFLGGNGGGENIAGSDVRKKNATSDLSSIEDAAKNADLKQAEDNLDGARRNEEDAGGLYNRGGYESKVRGKNSAKGKNVKAKGFLKKGGPVGAIIGLILAVGGLMGGSQLLQPFSLLEQFRETFNSMQTSARMRSNSFLRYQLSPSENSTRYKMFDSDNFKLSSNQVSKLKSNGIEYEENYNGTGARALKYDDGSGDIKIIAADEVSAAKIRASNVEVDGVKSNIEVGVFKDIYDTDAGFFKSYNSGSMTWRGAIANWFGSTTDTFIAQNDISRNKFKGYREAVEEAGGDTKVATIEVLAKGTEEIETQGGKVAMTNNELDTDEDGVPKVNQDTGKMEYNEQTKTVTNLNTGETTTTKVETEIESGDGKYSGGRISRSSIKSEADVKAKLDEIGDNVSGGSKNIGGTAQKVANYACLGVNFIGSVSLLVSASEALQIINLVTGYFEAIDKVKAGNGDDSPINVLANSLNQRKTSKYIVLEESDPTKQVTNMKEVVSNDGISTLVDKNESLDGSAMESAGIVSLYSGGKVNPNDPSVQSFNLTNSLKTILGGIGVGMGAFKACSLAKLVANGVSAIQEGLEVAGCIAGLLTAVFTAGASAAACGPLIADMAIGAAISVGASLLIAGIISAITPVVSNMLTRDLITDLAGEDLGNALTSGANMYLGNTHRFNGGSLATSEEYIAYTLAHEEVVAENAKYERMTKDPFDASSQYTFLGTLMRQMMSFSTINSITSAITSTSTVVSSSVASLMPTATAASIADNLVPVEEYEETCPYLASIGAVGDAYCNPYSVTDMSTIGSSPEEIVYTLGNSGNFVPTSSDSKVPRIKEGSDLAKYILFCDNRNSAFGIADQNIINEVTKFATVDTSDSTFNNTVNSAIGAVPAVGDIIDVVNSGVALANAGYISGESCVAGNSVSDAAAPNWEEAKYYQRFIEDQSLMESMGIIEESAVTAFLRDYYEENPLDNSYEGILARYSGLTKDQVIAVLDIIDYGNYIASYDPSTRYAFGEEIRPEDDGLIYENDNIASETYFILNNNIVYADLRTKNFVV